MGGSWQSQGWDTLLLLSIPSLADFQHGFFSPAFSTTALQAPLCVQPGSHPSALLKLLAGWGSASPFPAASPGEAWQSLAGVPDWQQDHALVGSQCGHPRRGPEPHLSATHRPPSYPAPSQNLSHKTWDHQVTSVAQQAQTVPERTDLCFRQGNSISSHMSPPWSSSPRLLVMPQQVSRHAGTVSLPAGHPQVSPAAPGAGRRAEAESSGHTQPRSQAGMPTVITLHGWAMPAGCGGALGE